MRAVANRLQHIYYTWRLFGRDASLIPPLDRMFDGTPEYGAFKANGDEFLRYYIELCQLQPDETILDVGSGIGRKTVPLTRYLNEFGTYEGIEIVKAGVDWCQRRITRKYPNFHFQQINVFNTYYNPVGTTKASEYRFPFDDAYFDFVALGSVFTHLLPADMENYLSEIARVLKPGGRCMITFFLLNQESCELIDSGKSTLNLRHGADMYRVLDTAMPERAIGYDEQCIVELYRKHGLVIQQPTQYGAWCGRQQFLSYQDIVVATKTAARANIVIRSDL
jgi:SAM-dependent methyltransferase